MGWFPLLVLIVFGMVSIAFMMQMPKEKPRHNIKRVIRGSGVVEPVDVVEPVEVVDVVESVKVVEPELVVEPEPEPEPVSTMIRPLTPPIKLEKSDDRYQQLKYITDAFKEHNVVYYLDGGSVLGAVRIGGVMNHDKDIDIATLDANEEDIEEALKDAKVQWEFQNSGTGPGNSGFGYKVTLKNTKTYIDIWLMSISGPNVVCVGRQNGCKRWLNKYHVNPEQLTQKTDVILPLRELRFGTEMLMFPNKVLDYLNKRYPNWKTKCGGWQRGTRECQPSENEYFRNYYEGNLELLGAKADKRKTVGIVTVMTKQNKWCECGTKTMQAYADTHGYSYYLITKENHFLKHVKFQKYAAVLDNMKHDIMVLMDCDIAITNPQIKVEEIFEEYNNDIIIARDAIWKKGVPINSGVIIFKNSQFSKGVLEKMKYSSKSTSNKYLGKPLVDQPVLTHLLVEKGIKEHPSTAFEKTNHITIVPQRVMNAFHRRGVSFFKNDPEDSRWRKGDWLAHVTGSPARIRTQIMKELGACKDKNTLIHDNHEKTTLVLMGFSPKRIPNYEILFKSYGSMTNVLDKIIFIWNNQDVDPPKIPSTDVSIKIWKSQVNSMVNRYRVYDYVDTVSVLTVDDDVLLSGLLIKDMIKTFYMDQSALIGLDERSFTKNKYSFRKTNANKLVIGKTMMWNKKYTKEFLLDNDLVSFSEENPCEDIAMNFLIRHSTGKEPRIIKMTYEKFRKNLNETDGLSIDPTTNWQVERNNCIAFMQTHFKDPYEKIFNMLKDLDTTISKHASTKQVYGNVFSGNAHDQVVSYTQHVKDFVQKYGAHHICEIGFAGGHSATTLLLSTEMTSAKYTAFDIWDREFYENTALKWVKERFPLRNIHIIKGDSTITVPNSEPLQCDIIHIDGAHHAHYPKTDYINMQKHASANNLLLIDDCTDSWKAVMEGVKFATDNNIFQERPKQFIPKAWSHRGKKKGWCIGSYSV
tara:strand:- start:4257 stop:7181 length:2925 start_codon:yes stop_codon:yes gene_type:complete